MKKALFPQGLDRFWQDVSIIYNLFFFKRPWFHLISWLQLLNFFRSILHPAIRVILLKHKLGNIFLALAFSAFLGLRMQSRLLQGLVSLFHATCPFAHLLSHIVFLSIHSVPIQVDSFTCNAFHSYSLSVDSLMLFPVTASITDWKCIFICLVPAPCQSSPSLTSLKLCEALGL